MAWLVAEEEAAVQIPVVVDEARHDLTSGNLICLDSYELAGKQNRISIDSLDLIWYNHVRPVFLIIFAKPKRKQHGGFKYSSLVGSIFYCAFAIHPYCISILKQGGSRCPPPLNNLAFNTIYLIAKFLRIYCLPLQYQFSAYLLVLKYSNATEYYSRHYCRTTVFTIQQMYLYTFFTAMQNIAHGNHKIKDIYFPFLPYAFAWLPSCQKCCLTFALWPALQKGPGKPAHLWHRQGLRTSRHRCHHPTGSRQTGWLSPGWGAVAAPAGRKKGGKRCRSTRLSPRPGRRRGHGRCGNAEGGGVCEARETRRRSTLLTARRWRKISFSRRVTNRQPEEQIKSNCKSVVANTSSANPHMSTPVFC